MDYSVALGMERNKMSEACLFPALAWCMGTDSGPMTISHTLLQGTRTWPVNVNHSQNPNSWPTEKYTKRLMSAFSWPH